MCWSDQYNSFWHDSIFEHAARFTHSELGLRKFDCITFALSWDLLWSSSILAWWWDGYNPVWSESLACISTDNRPGNKDGQSTSEQADGCAVKLANDSLLSPSNREMLEYPAQMWSVSPVPFQDCGIWSQPRNLASLGPLNIWVLPPPVPQSTVVALTTDTPSGWFQSAGCWYLRNVRPGRLSSILHSSGVVTSVPVVPHQPGFSDGVSSPQIP